MVKGGKFTPPPPSQSIPEPHGTHKNAIVTFLDMTSASSDHGLVRWSIYVGVERREIAGSLGIINEQILRA